MAKDKEKHNFALGDESRGREVEKCEFSDIDLGPSALTSEDKHALLSSQQRPFELRRRLEKTDVVFPRGETSPILPSGCVVACKTWFDAGLGLPLHPFIKTVLEAYNLELSHLSPGFFLRLRIFLWVCETAVKGKPLEPTLGAFSYYFRPQRTCSTDGKKALGSVFLVGLHEDEYPVHASKDYWVKPTSKWFYLKVGDDFKYTGNTAPVTKEAQPPLPRRSRADNELIDAITRMRRHRSVRHLMEEMTLLGLSTLVERAYPGIPKCDKEFSASQLISPLKAREEATALLGPRLDSEMQEWDRVLKPGVHNRVAMSFQVRLPPRGEPKLDFPRKVKIGNTTAGTRGGSTDRGISRGKETKGDLRSMSKSRSCGKETKGELQRKRKNPEGDDMQGCSKEPPNKVLSSHPRPPRHHEVSTGTALGLRDDTDSQTRPNPLATVRSSHDDGVDLLNSEEVRGRRTLTTQEARVSSSEARVSSGDTSDSSSSSSSGSSTTSPSSAQKPTRSVDIVVDIESPPAQPVQGGLTSATFRVRDSAALLFGLGSEEGLLKETMELPTAPHSLTIGSAGRDTTPEVTTWSPSYTFFPSTDSDALEAAKLLVDSKMTDAMNLDDDPENAKICLSAITTLSTQAAAAARIMYDEIPKLMNQLKIQVSDLEKVVASKERALLETRDTLDVTRRQNEKLQASLAIALSEKKKLEDDSRNHAQLLSAAEAAREAAELRAGTERKEAAALMHHLSSVVKSTVESIGADMIEPEATPMSVEAQAQRIVEHLGHLSAIHDASSKSMAVTAVMASVSTASLLFGDADLDAAISGLSAGCDSPALKTVQAKFYTLKPAAEAFVDSLKKRIEDSTQTGANKV